MSRLLRDFPPGPLDFYRKKASFDWKKLKLFLETEDVVRFENEVHEELKKYPELCKDLNSYDLDEERRRSTYQTFVARKIKILSLEHLLSVGNFKLPALLLRTMMQFNPGSTVKHSVGVKMFTSVIQGSGTDRHCEYLEDAEDGKILGSFCLTEMGHGTNTKGMRTTASYDKSSKQFIINTPDFEAAKCWAACVGQTATHSIVYAQLYVDGVHYGLHAFVVPIRDLRTLLPYPGVIVGDMGEKIGLNGIDNGFIIFDNYRIPRENLLNKNGDVTEDGVYVTPFKDPNKRHGASLGALSVGRINITGICEGYGTKAITIAVRYAAVRKQFGPENQPEIPILEYQSHQHRLLPYLASCYILRVFSIFIIEVQYNFSLDSIVGENKDILPDLGMELHAVSSACKPVAGWTVRDTIQECREACGGHGYLKVAGIGDIKNDHDANCTYEGENHVLIQQTSNWLLKFWPMIEKGEKITTPLHSVHFLNDTFSILGQKFKAGSVEEIRQIQCIVDAYQWLVCYLLRATKIKYESLIGNGKDAFTAKNESQVFYAKTLGIAFIQHFFLQRMLCVIKDASDPSIKLVLTRIFSLYGLWTLEKFLATFYEGGYAAGGKMTTLVHDGILVLCQEVKDDAVSLVDAIAPPDFILGSVLGSSDGEVYKRLQSAIFRSPYAMSRPKWWKDIVKWRGLQPKM